VVGDEMLVVSIAESMRLMVMIVVLQEQRRGIGIGRGL
jgi:hypothetical protein